MNTFWLVEYNTTAPRFHHISVPFLFPSDLYKILGNQATGRGRFNYTSFIYKQPSEILSSVPQNVKQPENYFFATFTFQRMLMKLENVWSFNIRRNIILIGSYHTCRVQMKPINSASSRWGFFPPILSLSLLAFQRWRWTADIRTWPSCIIKTVAAVTPPGEPVKNCCHHTIETPTIWSQMFIKGTGYLHFTGRNHMSGGLPFLNSIYSYLISISLADLGFSSLYLDWSHFTNRVTGCNFLQDFQTLAY